MLRFLMMTALILATAYALICLFLYLKQDALLYFPQPSANNPPDGAMRLVLVTPYDSVLGVAQGSYWWLPVHWLLRDKYESWRYAPKISVPTTLIVAGQDEMIPNRSSEQLFNRFAKGVATYHVMPDAGHNSITASSQYLSLLAGCKDS